MAQDIRDQKRQEKENRVKDQITDIFKGKSEEDNLLIKHMEYWEWREAMEDGKGMEMEWDRPPLVLVKGYGKENYRKRKWRKKQRWTQEALEIAKRGGEVRRKPVKAGRRLEGGDKRKRLELAKHQRAETLNREKVTSEKLTTNKTCGKLQGRLKI